jgi:hypothetical protein
VDVVSWKLSQKRTFEKRFQKMAYQNLAEWGLLGYAYFLRCMTAMDETAG